MERTNLDEWGRALKLMKRTFGAWGRYAMTGSHHEYKDYCKKRNEAQTTSDKLRRNFEQMIAKEAKCKP